MKDLSLHGHITIRMVAACATVLGIFLTGSYLYLEAKKIEAVYGLEGRKHELVQHAKETEALSKGRDLRDTHAKRGGRKVPVQR